MAAFPSVILSAVVIIAVSNFKLPFQFFVLFLKCNNLTLKAFQSKMQVLLLALSSIYLQTYCLYHRWT